MSLITCCPSCGTKFRVVADQLRISDGWVRCGRCQEVFDASQALEAPQMPPAVAGTPERAAQPEQPVAHVANAANAVDAAHAFGEEAVPPSPTTETVVEQKRELEPEPEPEPVLQETPVPAAHSGYELPAPPEPEELDTSWLDLALNEPAPGAPSIAQRLEAVTEKQAFALDFPSVADAVAAAAVAAAAPKEEEVAAVAEEVVAAKMDPVLDSLTPLEPVAPVEPAALHEPALDAPVEALPQAQAEAASAPIPNFVKQAQRKAWWSKPGVRFVMGMLVIFLPLALLLQITVHERNTLAAWQPQWRPALETLCQAMRCELAPRKDIAAVVLSGSSFAQDARPYHYRLDISIQNRSSLAVATPAVELTLTDAQDQVLVRKVLNLSDIGAPVELAGRSEWNGILPVKTEDLNLPVSGYRVMAFYP